MSELTTYSDTTRREDLKPQKAKSFDKKAYWVAKRGVKKSKKKKK